MFSMQSVSLNISVVTAASLNLGQPQNGVLWNGLTLDNVHPFHQEIILWLNIIVFVTVGN